jgi:hypothetical protein
MFLVTMVDLSVVQLAIIAKLSAKHFVLPVCVTLLLCSLDLSACRPLHRS